MNWSCLRRVLWPSPCVHAEEEGGRGYKQLPLFRAYSVPGPYQPLQNVLNLQCSTREAEVVYTTVGEATIREIM